LAGHTDVCDSPVAPGTAVSPICPRQKPVAYSHASRSAEKIEKLKGSGLDIGVVKSRAGFAGAIVRVIGDRGVDGRVVIRI